MQNAASMAVGCKPCIEIHCDFSKFYHQHCDVEKLSFPPERQFFCSSRAPNPSFCRSCGSASVGVFHLTFGSAVTGSGQRMDGELVVECGDR